LLFKAVVWKGNGLLEVVERTTPQPGQDEVLLRVRAAGICGTDLHILSGTHPQATPLLVPGHEFAGEVHAVGEGVDPALKGARVGSDSYKGCGVCGYCRSGRRQLCEHGTCELGVNIDGGWEEFVLVPRENLYPLPEEVSFAEAGAGCILNCPMAAVETSRVEAGDTLLIIGDGPSSLVMVQLARLKGAAPIIVAGHRSRRLELARKLGADVVVNTHRDTLADALSSLGGEPSVIIDAVGKTETLSTALSLAGKSARVHLFGLPEGPLGNLPMDSLLFKELTLTGSTGAPRLWGAAMEYLSQGLLRIEPIISHRFSLERAPEAIAFIRDHPQEVVKAIFEVN
jgi:threonine dehydrogenase-like Zn-dependent dehydrogenase